MNTIVILGCGFDLDLGLRNSCADFVKSDLCPMVGNEYWSDFEITLRNKVIQWYNNGRNEQTAKELNQLWQVYVKHISWFFTKQSDKYVLDKNTCAYRFLKRLKANSKSKLYTFNYTNPYEYTELPQVKEFTYLHGRYYRDTFNTGGLMVMSQGYNIIFGIDECIPEDGINKPKIYPLVKKHHPIYNETNIIADLSKAENVVFYGFSMGVIDYVYFEQFFNGINNGSSRCKKIYYVTKNKKGYNDFLNNLKVNNLIIENLLKRVNIVPVYTSKGFKNRDFRMMLRRL